MAEYLSTREVARYLKLNEKKVYALVKDGRIPAARVTGKWLFPKELIDRWVAEHTVYPTGGLMDALLEEFLVVQGSDDWLLRRVIRAIAGAHEERPVLSAWLGSLAGLSALSAGRAHVASSHVPSDVERAETGKPAYRLSLFTREQGIILDRARVSAVSGLEDLGGRRIRFASRQPRSGTATLVARRLADSGLRPDWTVVGPFGSHRELAFAIRSGLADAGVGIRIAADLAGLDFVPVACEAFQLVIPSAFMAHPRMAAFLEAVVDGVRREAIRAPPGYAFEDLGRLEGSHPEVP